MSDLATQLKELEDAKKLLEAEKGKLEAEKGRLEAAKALAAAKLANPTADATTEAEAQKKLVDAQKGLIEAQQQAWVSKFIGGTVQAGPQTGSVQLNDKAGTVEASLLAADAIRECAQTIATTIRVKVEAAQVARVYVFESSKPPSFERLMNFHLRFGLIQQAFAAAGIPEVPETNEAVALTAATVAAGLGAVANILGFFKTDTTVGGIEAKFDDALVVHAVAGAITRNVRREVHVPSLYKPKATADAVTALSGKLGELGQLRTKAAAKLKELTGTADAKPRADQLEAAIGLHDAFVAHLTTTDANGTVPLVAMAAEHALLQGMTGAVVLLLRLETSGGGYLVKKGFLAGLRRAPLYYMGGAAVSYVLFDGVNGNVLAGDVVPVYGEYVRASDLREALKK